MLKGDKDRFVLTAKFRKQVTESSGGNELLVTYQPDYKCLVGFGESYRDHRAALIRTRSDDAYLRGEKFDADEDSTIFGDAITVNYDSSGRMIIPAYMRRLAGITDAIFFFALGDTFLMWSPEVLAKQEARRWIVAREICQQMLEDARKGRK